MKKNKKTILPPIVIPVYNRPDSLKRLLASLNRAHFSDVKPELIISIEAGAPEETVQVSELFNFEHGNKTIIRRAEHLGVKNHIIECADLSDSFGSVLILEDDLIVAPDFYIYAINALNEYQRDDKIAGISLYAQRFNETAHLPFEPMPGEYSVYFMQLACSWGQAWTAEQWSRFKAWLQSKNKFNDDSLPGNMKLWGDESWKKLFNLYLLQNQAYFVYPYRSFTTNDSALNGQNMQNKGNLFQVPLGFLSGEKPLFQFPAFKDQKIRYDMYMESNAALMALHLEMDYHELCVDLYGTKPEEELRRFNYVITPRTGPEALREFPMYLKPIEMNILNPVTTNQQPFFYLYTKDQVGKLKPLSQRQYADMASYFSYFKPESKRFVRGFIPNLYRKFFNRK